MASSSLSGHLFIVTGGSSGLGQALVGRLLDSGASVAVWDLKEAKAGTGPRPGGNSCLFFNVDVTSEESVSKAVKGTREAFGQQEIRGLINCAGVGAPMKVLSRKGKPHKLKNFDFVVKVNLLGSFNTLRLVAKEMATNKPINDERGVIINTASIAAYEGQIGQASYSASKGGIVGMTLPIARELAAHGIRCNTVAPGIFLTPMMEGLPEKAKQSLIKQFEFPKRLGNPEEFAHLCQHIIENQYINGTVIRIDASTRMARM